MCNIYFKSLVFTNFVLSVFVLFSFSYKTCLLLRSRPDCANLNELSSHCPKKTDNRFSKQFMVDSNFILKESDRKSYCWLLAVLMLTFHPAFTYFGSTADTNKSTHTKVNWNSEIMLRKHSFILNKVANLCILVC